MNKIDYTPQEHFYMYPAPGPMSKSPLAKNALSMTIFEEHPPFTNAPGAAEFIDALSRARREGRHPGHRASRCRPRRRTRRGRSSRPACAATKSLDDKAIAAWLKKNRVDTIQGKLRFDGPSNYGDDLMRVKQVQNGRWVTVWPKEFAAPGADAADVANDRDELPSATLLAQSALSGVFIGACTGCWGSGSACRGACCT